MQATSLQTILQENLGGMGINLKLAFLLVVKGFVFSNIIQKHVHYKVHVNGLMYCC